MQDRARNREIVELAAFSHYLRTGERFDLDALVELYERKFNPYHAADGKFSSAPGVTQSWGEGSARFAEQSGRRDTPVSPASAQTVPPGGRIAAEAGLRAAKIARDAMKQARSRVLASHPPVRALLHQIARGEGVDDDVARTRGYASSYDVPFNYGRYAQQSKPLTRMTLGEIDELQTRILAHPENRHRASPVGKYQIVQRTLRDLKATLGLRDNVIFDRSLQDMLAAKRLEQRGIQDYVDGNISEVEFQRRMAKEWASIADPATGSVARGQHLGTTSAQLLPLIRALRKK